MEADLAAIRKFLRGHEPFALLPTEVIESLPAQVKTLQAAAETVVLRAREPVRWLYIVRRGVIGIRAINGDLSAQRIKGETFGVRALLTDGRSVFDAVALEDVFLYLLPDATFARLRNRYPEFDRFFSPLGGSGRSLGRAEHQPTVDVQSNLIALRIRDVMRSDPPTIEGDRQVGDGARLLRDRRLSCLPVTVEGKPVGMITRRELCDGVLATGGAAETPVSEAMTALTPALAPHRLAIEAALALGGSARYLPVEDGGRLIGLVAEADLQRRQRTGFDVFATSIFRAKTAASMAKIVAQIPQLLTMLVETGSSAHAVGLTVTSVADAATFRLLQLAEERLGPPPVLYVWLSSGSQARQEQTGISDQDNCLILDDTYAKSAHGTYFEELARFVCDGLHACGYDYCPGEMMAITPKWRQPLSRWTDYFSSWIAEPEPTAQMLSSVMFDLRPIYGDTGLFDRLQDVTSKEAKSGGLFLAHMAGHALSHAPPISFFRRFVLARGGDHDQRLDLKLHGTVPIIDLARIYALQAGVRSANTRDRLIEAQQASVISETGMHDLIDSFALIAAVRLKHQSRQIRSGQRPDNFVSPDELSRIERHHLRDAFVIVRTTQTDLAHALQIRR
ncbi:MAG: putative nucleotidyltransferase substrate binding domain-containing protein [Rhodospirillales bacterium]